MASVSLKPHNGVNRRRRRQRQLPAASKICNIHQSHSTAQHTERWPGMRMSSRAALERSNSFRIRVFAYSHSYSCSYSYSFSEPTAGSSCACGALFLGLRLICLAHFQVNYTYLWHLRHSNMKINAVGRRCATAES